MSLTFTDFRPEMVGCEGRTEMMQICDHVTSTGRHVFNNEPIKSTSGQHHVDGQSLCLHPLQKYDIWNIYIVLYKKFNISNLKFVYDNNCHIQILDEKYQNLYMTIY